jgi:arylsulfatase
MADQPHVLLITTDHWPAALMGVAGHPTLQTPTLDQLARNGIRYTNAYSECPVCIPARRTLMTGATPRTHGDRIFKVQEPMPALPSLAQTFRDAGYQAYGVGKLHIFPQRNRIGFDDVVLSEEGRSILGAIDDYDIWLAEEGFPGESYGHGMSNNDYGYRPWHLPEHTHVTNWATREMCRMIRRRDPTRPGFWYLSYGHPHPPLVPLAVYLDLYRDVDPRLPVVGEWAAEMESLPYTLRAVQAKWGPFTQQQIRGIHRAFFALCTHIDHQLRLVIGTLREEQLLDNTVILFTADHGDMLGNHGLWAKRLFYEQAANVPMILVGAAGDPRVGHHRVDERLVGWQDVMPTLLDLAGIEIPASVDGLSMIGAERRAYLYGECGEDAMATRMIRERRHKLIYYPVGNYTQLFDLETDPEERHNLAGLPDYAEAEERLTRLLIDEFYGGDEAWLDNGALIGLPDQPY